uniref:M-phase phosphoprotein 6 n=1 Tax=Strix occidentalis caurina TaxID=311401 RepID=A0A8D0FH85_STROC
NLDQTQRKITKNIYFLSTFMQRGLDSQTKKQLEEEEKKIISEEHWYLDLPDLKEKESFIIEERSFMPCEDLLYGRMSFKGFNPEIEVPFKCSVLLVYCKSLQIFFLLNKTISRTMC